MRRLRRERTAAGKQRREQLAHGAEPEELGDVDVGVAVSAEGEDGSARDFPDRGESGAVGEPERHPRLADVEAALGAALGCGCLTDQLGQGLFAVGDRRDAFACAVGVAAPDDVPAVAEHVLDRVVADQPFELGEAEQLRADPLRQFVLVRGVERFLSLRDPLASEHVECVVEELRGERLSRDLVAVSAAVAVAVLVLRLGEASGDILGKPADDLRSQGRCHESALASVDAHGHVGCDLADVFSRLLVRCLESAVGTRAARREARSHSVRHRSERRS